MHYKTIKFNIKNTTKHTQFSLRNGKRRISRSKTEKRTISQRNDISNE